ncbi:hypothetical protein EBR57_02915 [bacterium]|nr:hypothetical protein [bacterium]
MGCEMNLRRAVESFLLVCFVAQSGYAVRTLTLNDPVRLIQNFPEQTSVLVQPNIYLDSDGGAVQTVRCKIIQGLQPGDKLYVTTGNAAPNNSANFTQSYNSGTGILTITDPNPTSGESATGGTWEALLKTLTLSPQSMYNSQNNVRSIEFEVLESGTYYSHPDGTYHYYDFVAWGAYPIGSTDAEGKGTYWNGAKADAASAARKYYGKTGYLATITSTGENDFLYTQVGSTDVGWVGGSDISSEGTWLWKTGPEAGYQIGGVTYPYTKWNSGEPNDAGGEDYMQMLNASNQKWNDLNGDNTGLGYFIEWGGMNDPGTIVTVKIQNRNAIKHGAGF